MRKKTGCIFKVYDCCTKKFRFFLVWLTWEQQPVQSVNILAVQWNTVRICGLLDPLYSMYLSKSIVLPSTVSCAVPPRQDIPTAELPNAWPEILPLFLPVLRRCSVLWGRCKGSVFKKAQHSYWIQVNSGTCRAAGGFHDCTEITLFLNMKHFYWLEVIVI